MSHASFLCSLFRFFESNKAHFALISAQLCFSGFHLLGSLSLGEGANPIVFSLYRGAIAAAFLYMSAKYYAIPVAIEFDDWPRLALVALGLSINYIGASFGLQYLSAAHFAIFQPSIPCVATVISIILGYDSFTILRGLGITVAAAGAIFAEMSKSSGASEEDKNFLIGTISTCAQVLGLSFMQVLVKPLLGKYDPTAVTLLFTGIQTFYIFILCAVMGMLPMINFITLQSYTFQGNVMAWVAVVFAGAVVSFYAFAAMSWAGRELSPSVTTVYLSLQPVGTILLSFLILGTVTSFQEICGAALVILGLALTVLGNPGQGERSVSKLEHGWNHACCSFSVLDIYCGHYSQAILMPDLESEQENSPPEQDGPLLQSEVETVKAQARKELDSLDTCANCPNGAANDEPPRVPQINPLVHSFRLGRLLGWMPANSAEANVTVNGDLELQALAGTIRC